MEIKFENVSYIINPKTTIEDIRFNNISFEIGIGITAICGKNTSDIAKLITMLRLPTNGHLYLDVLDITKKSHINNINNIRKKICLVSNKVLFIKKTVKEELEYVLLNYHQNFTSMDKKISDVLQLVGFNDSYLNKEIALLSKRDQLYISLCIGLIYNPSVLILDHIDNVLIKKDQNNLKLILKKLVTKYHKKVILISDDVLFLYDIATNYLVFDEGNLVLNITKKEMFNKEIFEYIDKPPILEFIERAEKKGAKIDNYYDTKELLKAVYRDVQ